MGIYPYLPSGNIILSDMQTGLYIFDCSTPNTVITEETNTTLFPNPAKDQFIIKNEWANNIILYNMLGMPVRKVSLNKNETIIYRNNLKKGLYFYNLYDKNKILETGKILFE